MTVAKQERQEAPLRYTLDHVVINTPDLADSVAAYQTRFGSLVLTRTSCEVTLYHHSPVLLILRQSDAAAGIHHVAYGVDDAAAAWNDLRAKGVRAAWDLTVAGSLRHCGFYDADGLPFQIFSTRSKRPPRPSLRKPIEPGALRFHHVNILTPDVRRSIRFYEQMLGLRVALTFRPDFSGFNFLMDPAFDQHAHNFMLEITGPPELDARETAYLDAHGPSYDHICFLSADPAQAHHRLIAQGAPSLYEPEEYFDTVLAWVEDPQRVHVELMKPIPAERLAGVLQGGPPLCFMTPT